MLIWIHSVASQCIIENIQHRIVLNRPMLVGLLRYGYRNTTLKVITLKIPAQRVAVLCGTMCHLPCGFSGLSELFSFSASTEWSVDLDSSVAVPFPFRTQQESSKWLTTRWEVAPNSNVSSFPLPFRYAWPGIQTDHSAARIVYPVGIHQSRVLLSYLLLLGVRSTRK